MVQFKSLLSVIFLFGLIGLVAACGADQDSSATGEDPEIAADEELPGPENDNVKGSAEEEVQTTEPVPDETIPTSPPAPPTMPNFVGGTLTEASLIIADLGADAPVVAEQESLEPSGTVLKQVPSPGGLVTGTISLIIAIPIQPMPDFVGGDVSAARSWASERGLTVSTETVLSADSRSGTVLDQLPLAGTQPGGEISLTVSEEPVIVNLANLLALEQDSYRISDFNMNGSFYPAAPYFQLRNRSGSYKTAYADFNLGRDWSALRMDLGIDDFDSIDAVVIVEFIADGQVVQTETVAFGAITPIEVDVTDVLRLRITAQVVAGSDSADVGMGNAQLIGGAAAEGQ